MTQRRVIELICDDCGYTAVVDRWDRERAEKAEAIK